jgi:hypothetical protein
MAVGLGVASLIVGLGGAIKADHEQKKAERAQSKARKEQSAQRGRETETSKRQALREERVRRAQLLQAGENTGTSGSSSETGSISNLAANVGANLAFQTGALASADLVTSFSQEAAGHQRSASRAQTVGGIGQQIFGATAGPAFQAIKAGSVPQMGPPNPYK